MNEILRTIGIAVLVLGAGFFLGINSGGNGDSGQLGEYTDLIAEKDRRINDLSTELRRVQEENTRELETLRAGVERGLEENRRLRELIDGAAGYNSDTIEGVRKLDELTQRSLALLRDLREAEQAAGDSD